MTQQQEFERARKRIDRRTVTRGAAWSVPVVSLAMAAPAAAHTSGCVTKSGKLDWDTISNGYQCGKTLPTTLAGVTVMVTLSGDKAASGNGAVTGTTTGGQSKVMRFYDQNNKANTTQTVLISFYKDGKPLTVQTVSFSVLDVDSDVYCGKHEEDDRVTILTPGWTGSKGSNVLGSGTSADPYRPKTDDSPVSDSSSAGNVGLSWAGNLTSVGFAYGQHGSVCDCPHIGISDICFSYCG